MRWVSAVVFVVMVAGCSAPTAIAPTATSSPVTLTSTLTPTVAPTASPRPTPAPSPTPTPIIDLSQVFRPLANGWRPTGPTLMFSTSEGDASTLIGVPIGPNGRAGEPVRLVTFSGQGWDLRSDGGALVVAVRTATGVRIATWDVTSMIGRWVTQSDSGALISTPVWSNDGRSIFFGSFQGTAGTVNQIGADGQGMSTLANLDRFGGLEGITPDGRGLIWTRGQAGGSAEILNIATATSKHLDDVARVVSWRAQQPRILLSVGGCCAGRPGGSLVAFDDGAMTSRVIADRSPNGTVAFGSGAWDPTGTRVAAARYDENSPYDASLVIVDTATGTIRPLSDVLGVGVILWLDEGIVVTRTLTRGATTDVVLVPPQGGPSVALYRGAGIFRVVVVRP